MNREHHVQVVTVALPVPLLKTFDYEAPTHCQRGDLVEVSFGTRQLQGVILRTGLADPGIELKAVASVIRSAAIPDNLLQLAEWMSAYYHHPIGEVLLLWLPPWCRQADSEEGAGGPAYYQVCPDPDVRVKLSPVQEKAWHWAQALHVGQPITATLAKLYGHDERTLLALAKKGLLVQTGEQTPSVSWPDFQHTLSEEQGKAATAIRETKGFDVHVLQGVTGSGKTEVYLRSMRTVLQAGKRVLFLVPEIGLTPQMVDSLKQALPVRIAVVHSQLPDRLRAQVWAQCRRGEVDILLGTRSAVFCPLDNLGLVVLDEEHDASFKEHAGCRYHARDVAIMRAHRSSAAVVLGSATPSIETMANLPKPHYHHHRLLTRVVGQMPSCQVMDMRGHAKKEGVDARLFGLVKRALEAGEQALIFLNRRGYAPVWFCQNCAWHARCRHCDVNLTYHRDRDHLRCHHCSTIYSLLQECPDCHQESVIPVGLGTERIEALFKEQLPDFPVIRIDRDTVTGQRQWLAQKELIESNQPMVILGTQMLAKGHDFTNIGLVIVLGLDQGLLSHDYKATERTMQLAIQVAGRAGRAREGSQVILPTHYPQAPVFKWLRSWDYNGYVEAELACRQKAQMPPSTHAVRLSVECRDPHTAQAWLKAWRDTRSGEGKVRELGPVPAAIAKRQGRYRSEMLVTAPARPQLHAYVAVLEAWVEGNPVNKLSIDIDPE